MDPDRDEKYRALYQAAVCSYRLLRIDDGLDYLEQLIQDEIYFDSLGALNLRVAEGYEYEDELDLACDVYLDVAETAEKGPTQAEAYYRLGLIYQYDYDDLIEAKRFYDLTAQRNKTGESGRDALQRSSDIGKLETFARSAELDSTATKEVIDNAAYTQYLLAELYWFKLNKPDTAILEMQYCVDSFPDAYDAPNAMIALSQMYREHKKDTSAADSILNELLRKYPHSDFVVGAIELLGLAGTEADSGYAELYIHRAEDLLVDEGQVDSARYYYQHVVDNYPDSRYHLQARFNLIWLTEMHDNPGDSTVYYAYQEFADSFPGTELALAAKGKLQARPRPRPGQSRDEEIDEEDIPDEKRARILAARERRAAENREEEADPFSGYGDAIGNMYLRPNGDTIITLDLDPVETIEPFEFPIEAAGLEPPDIELYFHILLDFSGKVIKHELKIPSQFEELNQRANRTIASMTFDPVDVSTLVQISDLRESDEGEVGYWFVYKFPVEKPEYLR
jgi:TolA-binding protein